MSKKKILILILVPLALMFISITLGRYSIPPLVVFKALLYKITGWEHTWSSTVDTVIFKIRLPRILLAMMIGAGLSISGASFQGMFRNPLVSQDILGVSAAAGFGASLAILLSWNAVAIQTTAFITGVSGVMLAYALSRVYKTTPILMLVLSGVVVSSLFGALIGAMKYLADPLEKLPEITFWLMGSLNSARWDSFLKVVLPISVGTIGLLLVRWRINVLAMGDEEARSLGIRTELLKGVIIICTTLVTAASVCVSGMIGWIGLVIPHITRMIVGPDNRILLPATLSIGASYLLIIDNVARVATSAELPLGILTSLIGAPFFAYLLRKTKGGWK